MKLRKLHAVLRCRPHELDALDGTVNGLFRRVFFVLVTSAFMKLMERSTKPEERAALKVA